MRPARAAAGEPYRELKPPGAPRGASFAVVLPEADQGGSMYRPKNKPLPRWPHSLDGAISGKPRFGRDGEPVNAG